MTVGQWASFGNVIGGQSITDEHKEVASIIWGGDPVAVVHEVWRTDSQPMNSVPYAAKLVNAIMQW